MGNHNPRLMEALSDVFDCKSIDWTDYGFNSDALQDDIIQATDNFNPNYVLLHIQSGNVVTDKTLKILSSKTKVINWTGDVRYPLPQHYIETGKQIHLTLFTNMNDVLEIRAQGIMADYLQVGFDDVDFTPVGSTNKYFQPILFLGSNYLDTINFPLSKFRCDMVKLLKQEFNSDFGLYGSGWPNKDGILTRYADEAVAYRTCKIAINLSHFDYSRYTSDRMLRIMGSGAFCLTHHYTNIQADFNIGNEIATWKTLDELLEKIKYYLEHEDERTFIAGNGCSLVRTKYTWHNFANNLKDLIHKYE